MMILTRGVSAEDKRSIAEQPVFLDHTVGVVRFLPLQPELGGAVLVVIWGRLLVWLCHSSQGHYSENL